MARPKKPRAPKQVQTIRHDEDKRTNIPTAEDSPLLSDDDRSPRPVEYKRRNPDLDPQLVWRGKEQQDLAGLVVNAAPLYIQEKVQSKALIDDLLRHSRRDAEDADGGHQADMFADFNGLPEGADRTEFYQHDANWQNRMILGDSLQVMASLDEREGLRGKVQCIYIDPPYGIKFNSNFQWSTTSRDVRDGKADHITREPEQVKAFRDTWRDGIHSYLSYLRDRLIVARDLLTDSGSIFVQIGDENVHRVRSLMDEVFGEENFMAQISFVKTANSSSIHLPRITDCIIWYSKSGGGGVKYRTLWREKEAGSQGGTAYREISKIPQLKNSGRPNHHFARLDQITSQSGDSAVNTPVDFQGRSYRMRSGSWKTTPDGFRRLDASGRLAAAGNTLSYVRFLNDFPVFRYTNTWSDTSRAGFTADKRYVVETIPTVIQRCILMTTDPGDLVLDPTCGSGTTAYVAEQWGRRWITIDTSRVALALARARVMGARYPWYLLADSPGGQQKEAQLTQRAPSDKPTYGDIRQGFVYERVPHIMLRDIANNAEIDVIWERWQETLAPLLARLNDSLGQTWEEWGVPWEAEADWPADAADAHAKWREARIARQQAIDASIAANAGYEYLYDKPYVDNRKVRVAGPFTVESLSPHRMLAVNANGDPIDRLAEHPAPYDKPQDFASMILENLERAGVQQAHKEDRIVFSSVEPWPGGGLICAEARYIEGATENDDGDATGGVEKRAGVFIGPEFGTVTRPDLVEAAREAAEAGFDVLIACAFNYEAHTTEFERLGRIPVLKARMNADLHMADDLKPTGKGNLFVIFGEPDINILGPSDDPDIPSGQVQVKVNGVDVYDPSTGEIRSDGPDGIACWFIDTDYNEESFFVRHAYFLGQRSDPYQALKTSLKAEINREAWETLNSAVSRPFAEPESGRIAVKVINHLGDEVMKVFRVP